MVATRRFSSNMFLNCLTGPMRNIVAHKDTKLPKEYRIANRTGLAIVMNDCKEQKPRGKSIGKRQLGALSFFITCGEGLSVWALWGQGWGAGGGIEVQGKERQIECPPPAPVHKRSKSSYTVCTTRGTSLLKWWVRGQATLAPHVPVRLHSHQETDDNSDTTARREPNQPCLVREFAKLIQLIHKTLPEIQDQGGGGGGGGRGGGTGLGRLVSQSKRNPRLLHNPGTHLAVPRLSTCLGCCGPCVPIIEELLELVLSSMHHKPSNPIQKKSIKNCIPTHHLECAAAWEWTLSW
jgi:hypothetical protein